MKQSSDSPNISAVRILSAGHMINDSYGGFIFPILPIIATTLNIPLGLVGLLISIPSLFSSFLQPVFGYLSDIMTKRFFIFWGLLLSAVFISLIGYANNYFVLMFLLLMGNMGVGLFHPQATALAGNHSGKEINNLMGTFIACGTIGFATGPIVSSFLVGQYGLKSTIWAIFPGLIMAYLIYKFVPKIEKKENKTEVKKRFILGMFKTEKIISLLAFTSVIRAVTIISFTILMPFLLKDQGLSTLTTGIAIALFSFLGGIGSYLGGKLSNKFGQKTIMFLSFLPAIPCLLGTLFLAKSMIVLSIILFVLAGFILMSSTSVNMVIAQKAAPNDTALVSGLIGGFCWGIAHLLQSPVGFIADKFGIISTLSVIACIPILGAISTLFIPKRYS